MRCASLPFGMQAVILLTLISYFYTKENAVIIILCRNNEAENISKSLIDFEETFNKQYKYPYVFLNDVDWEDQFKKKVLSVISAPAEFGKLTPEQWGPPSWIDKEKMKKNMKAMKDRRIIYGGSLNYRNMCRFFSGFFYKHDLVKKYDYYWRIEPDVNFYCKMNYDPFEFLRKANKQYGFVLCLKEFMETIPSLWSKTLEYLQKNEATLKNNEIMSFILDQKKEYNGCHFWSNFEIANLNFFRSEVYENYFKFLDESGGFYYERWGDAPIHSIAASLFLGKAGIHYFEDIGYRHSIYQHCPTAPSRAVDCKCDPKLNAKVGILNCLKEYIIESI